MMYCQRSPAGKLYSKIRLRPQKPAYMRMDGGKTTVRPQKQPYMRMDGRSGWVKGARLTGGTYLRNATCFCW